MKEKPMGMGKRKLVATESETEDRVEAEGKTQGVGRALMQSRKFQVLLLACSVYLTPVTLIFILVLKGMATKEDLVTMTKWMGVSLSPAFLGYIGGVAIEDAADKKSKS